MSGRAARTPRTAMAAFACSATALALLGTSGVWAQQTQETPFPIAAWSRTEARDETVGSLQEQGAAVFNNWCSACHSRGPMNAPGTTSLEYKYRGEVPAALEDRTDLTAEVIELYVRNGVAMMPIFRKTELSDADVEALAAYLVKR
jgi:mono/diheme cytochrome c family protein